MKGGHGRGTDDRHFRRLKSVLRMAGESSNSCEGQARTLEARESRVTSEKPAKFFVVNPLQPIGASAKRDDANCPA
jgi:hypothetical protein